MYFIEDGTVSIKIQQDKGETEISKLEKGQYFGNLINIWGRWLLFGHETCVRAFESEVITKLRMNFFSTFDESHSTF